MEVCESFASGEVLAIRGTESRAADWKGGFDGTGNCADGRGRGAAQTSKPYRKISRDKTVRKKSFFIVSNKRD